MLLAIDRHMYQLLLDVETMSLMEYKVSPSQFLARTSVVDLQIMLGNLRQKYEEAEQNRSQSRGGRLLHGLAAIRAILNNMDLPDPQR